MRTDRHHHPARRVGDIDRRRVVVGVDDSSTALNAARWAAYLAGTWHAPLLIACATRDHGSVSRYADRFAARGTAERAVELVRTTDPNLAADIALVPGPPGRALVELSEHARIMVVGGQTAFESWLIGPTTRHVVERAYCPVAVWRGTNGRPIRRRLPVAVGVDGSAVSTPAIAHGFDIASVLGVPLVAVHTWPPRIPPIGQHRVRDEQERVLLAESLAGWREEYPDVDVVELSVPGVVTSVLADVARHVQLLVVGSRGRGAASAALLGSTSRALLHHVPSPVLVCRTESG